MKDLLFGPRTILSTAAAAAAAAAKSPTKGTQKSPC